jgi:hypothetical protein
MLAARPVAPGFSPLDEVLGLLPGHLTPWLAEGVVRLGSAQPFATACQTLTHFTGTTIGEATARRLTERVGASWVQLELRETARLIADPTAAMPPGAPVQQLSVDGVFVPLVGGEWREVKVLAIGTVTADDDDRVTTTELSYWARLADHERFGREALAELHRRGTLSAATVVAVQDGAEWIQRFLDLHVPTAVRVLDFAHAAGYLGQAAQGAFGAGTREASAWLETWLHELKHGDPDRVLEALAAFAVSEAREEAVRYLTARRDQITYAAFRAAGYPIGSGCVESAAKLLVQARLCGAGMHWAACHVDALLGLRAILPTERWHTAWVQITAHLRQQTRQVATTRRALRRSAAPPIALPRPLPPRPRPAPPVPEAVLRLRQEERERPKRIVNGRPTADHPFKRALPARPAVPASPSLPKL